MTKGDNATIGENFNTPLVPQVWGSEMTMISELFSTLQAAKVYCSLLKNTGVNCSRKSLSN